MKLKKRFFLLSFLTIGVLANAAPRFSVAGFYPLENTGRTVHSMNPAWRFHKGDISNAWHATFDDAQWQIVSLPHGIEELPVEASGCVNYQGVVWYRKYFDLPSTLKGKKLFLHFEAIMGKSKVWINGKMVKEHFGGYLPLIIDATEYLDFDKKNVIAVRADNSDDPIYPPGKQQDMLDFAYLGGIYRDCWLIAHNDVFISDANYVDKTASGGLFVSYGKVSEQFAEARIKVHVKNEKNACFRGKVRYELLDKQDNIVAASESAISIASGGDISVEKLFGLKNPNLWSPERPYLYNLCVYVKDSRGKIVDGYRRRVGIRSVEFNGKEGFWLNGKPYGKPIIGANRHQDYAVVGNAVSNNLHWRDAVK